MALAIYTYPIMKKMCRLSYGIKWLIANVCLLLLLVSRVCAQTSAVNQIQLKLNQNPPDTARLKLLKQLSDAYSSVDPIKKLYYANVFKALAEKLHDERAIADAYVQIGISYANRSKYDSALVQFQLAYNQSAKIKYVTGMGKSLMDMGFVHDRLDETKDAIKCDFDALAIVKNTNNKKIINQLYTNIGSIYFDLRKYKLAESYFSQCLINVTAAKDTAGIGYALFTVGNCMQALRQDEKARDDFTRSLAIRQKLGDINGVALCTRGLGQVEFHEKHYDQSIIYLNTALTTIRTLQDKYEECAVLLDLSDVYLAMKDYDKAEASGKLCLSESKGMKSQTGVGEALQRLINVYKAKGDLKNAFKYQSDYIETQDDIANAKALKDVTLTEFSRVRTENAALAKNNQLITSKNTDYLSRINRYSNVIVVILVGLVLVTLLLLILYRRNQEKQAANKQLLLQKEEIAAINNELELLNEEINAQIELTNSQNIELERVNNIKNKFFSIVSHDLRGPIASLQTLLSIYREGDVDEQELGMLLGKLEDTIINTGSFLDNLLEWSKSQMEGIVINTETFDISACIAENIQLFESKVAMKNLKVVKKATEPIMAYADKNMMNLVIRNILSNSIKFCKPNDEITLSAEVKGNRVLMAIRDTGPGISQTEQAKLFSLEHSLSSGTHGEKGNHLGLILCRDMVIQNNGKIGFETEEGKGTTFWVEIPAAG